MQLCATFRTASTVSQRMGNGPSGEKSDGTENLRVIWIRVAEFLRCLLISMFFVFFNGPIDYEVKVEKKHFL